MVNWDLFTLAIFAAISSAIFLFWWMWTSRWVTNVLSTCALIWTFIAHLLVHIHQKKKIALEIAAKIASVDGPLVSTKSRNVGRCNTGTEDTERRNRKPGTALMIWVWCGFKIQSYGAHFPSKLQLQFQHIQIDIFHIKR
jgi:hypothetical protein